MSMIKGVLWLIIVELIIVYTYDNLWQYPGYFWENAFLNPQQYWISFYADNCPYIINEYLYNSTNITQNSLTNIDCLHINERNIEPILMKCENDTNCQSMLVQTFHFDHFDDPHFGEHIIVLFNDKLSNNNELSEWKNTSHIASVYIEKGNNGSTTDCVFVTITLVCFHSGGTFKIYSKNNASYIPIQGVCDLEQFNINNLYGRQYCIKPGTYYVETNGTAPKDPSFEMDSVLYVSQFGKHVAYMETKIQETDLTEITIIGESILYDQCNVYSQVSFYSYLGDGVCDDVVNKFPCFDDGDCCRATCDEIYNESEIIKCGSHGYDCRNPNLPEYTDFLGQYFKRVDIELKEDGYSISVDGNTIQDGLFYSDDAIHVIVLDKSSGFINDTFTVLKINTEPLNEYLLNIAYQHYVIIFGTGNSLNYWRNSDDTSNIINILGLENAIQTIGNGTKIYGMTGQKGGFEAHKYVDKYSFNDSLALYPNYVIDSDSYFDTIIIGDKSNFTISKTVSLMENCTGSDSISFKYYILNPGNDTHFDITAPLAYINEKMSCYNESAILNLNTTYKDKIIIIIKDWVSACDISTKIRNAELLEAKAVILLNSINNGKLLDTIDSSIPVLSMGLDGFQVWYSVYIGTLFHGEIYSLPNYTISHSKLCGNPVGLHELKTCTPNETLTYDRCISCECTDYTWNCTKNPCLMNTVSCGECEYLSFENNTCCGECIKNTTCNQPSKAPTKERNVWSAYQVTLLILGCIAIIGIIILSIHWSYKKCKKRIKKKKGYEFGGANDGHEIEDEQQCNVTNEQETTR